MIDDVLLLTDKESTVLKQHLSRILRIDRQIAILQKELISECDMLEIVWQNIYRRYLLDMVSSGVKVSELHVPSAIVDGSLRLAFMDERRVKVVKNG